MTNDEPQQAAPPQTVQPAKMLPDMTSWVTKESGVPVGDKAVAPEAGKETR